ncbi:peptidoglycan DD-metalloendopeptidase family protein [Streptomyces sp. Go40/10]|uniref:M23 family metallopeptidase n=1 Tax=Streptomyces sp. Go40/10 TaxID=2825844 RepID=UPI001E626981|nr:M23 family metallopeptidase [Streptomyces sp. Go40/10]UFR01030.1 peptidoglycan DD-metalloendopeptidase family protein [Streptomyces sp. Go40/10]
MPAKGKHRRPKTPRFSRSLAVAGTGGAALALPLVGTTGAHAATPAQPVSGTAVQSLPNAAQQTAAQRDAGARTYTVRSGDCLSKIAEEQRVDGGWQRLYDDNRQAVGADPALIHPGLKLTLGALAAPARTEPAAPKPAPTSPAGRAPQTPKAAQGGQASQTSESSGSGAAQTASAGYTLPVAGATIGTGYHVAGSMWSSGHHTGVDFVVPTGTPLRAVAAGTVVSAGWGGAYGNQVVLRLNDGHYAQYAHLSQLSVSAGQAVTAGQRVGLSGATGNVTGPHLHFEIRTTPDYGSDVDPVAYLRAHGVAVG